MITLLQSMRVQCENTDLDLIGNPVVAEVAGGHGTFLLIPQCISREDGTWFGKCLNLQP